MTEKTARLRALQRQIYHLDSRIARLRALSEQYTRVRLAVFVAALVITFGMFSQVSEVAGWISAALGLVVFMVIARRHRRVDVSTHLHEAYRQIKTAHIARIELDWPNIPPEHLTPLSPDHPFAADLDIIGEFSLHRLMDTAVSREGGERLQTWLLNPVPDPRLIEHRQILIRELIPLAPFRDRLTLNARLISGGRIEGKRLLSWFEYHTATHPTRRDVIIAAALAAINLGAFVLSAQPGMRPIWPVTFIVYVLYSRDRLSKAGDLFAQSMSLGELVNNLNAVFRFLETYRYGANAALKVLCAPFLDPHKRPSAQIRQVGRIVSAVSLRGNPLLWFLINAAVPWDMYFAYRLNRRKAEIAAHLPRWLDVWFELESVCSLATFAYLNPEFTFPVLVDAPVFKSEQIGHPLIPYTTKVCNDFALTELGTLVIITGSNMAGKSSFLRTLGVNLCLAYAGGVVNAARLETGLFRVFTCIRVSDSVTEGFSYFYAEVRRLKALLEALNRDHPYPLFFLIDEIFRGTNNRERLIGSRAYIRALVGQHGLGLISTHDLELVRLADEMPQVSNMHFREEVIDGQMIFDYRLRTGPSPTTNALKIMVLQGLPVE